MFELEIEEQPEFERYLDLYSQILDTIIDVHNKHSVFKNRRGRESAKDLRKSLRELGRTQAALSQSVWKSYKECLVNSKIRSKRSKELKLKYRSKKEQLENNK